MGLLFVGGEDSDFSSIGGCAVFTTAGYRRTSYSRCSLGVNGTSSADYDGWHATFAATANFWVGAQCYQTWNTVGFGTAGHSLMFFDGSTERLFVCGDGATGGGTIKYRLCKVTAAGSVTVLATAASASYSLNQRVKLDAQVTYGTSGNFKLYVNGTLVIDYTGDLTTDGATTLSGVRFGHVFVPGWGSDGFQWSECMVNTQDTRSLSLVTMYPSGAGNSSGWSGAHTDIDETTESDDSVTSGTANQLSQFTVTQAGALSGSVSISALVVAAKALCGSTGPQNLQLNVRTGGADYQSASKALGNSFAQKWEAWTTNPGTSWAVDRERPYCGWLQYRNQVGRVVREGCPALGHQKRCG